MRNSHGFTLIETMVTTGILISGLLAVAALFSYATSTNVTTQQRTSATILLFDKMEYLRSLSLSNSALAAGGGLISSSKQSGYYDYVTINSDGTLTVDAASTSSSAPFLRLWQIVGTNPKTITVIVFAQRSGLTRRQLEMIRAATMVTNRF